MLLYFYITRCGVTAIRIEKAIFYNFSFCLIRTRDLLGSSNALLTLRQSVLWVVLS